MTTTDMIQFVSSMIALIGVIVTAIGIYKANQNSAKQLNILNTQLKLNFFSDYTKRYQSIILNFPENINEPTFDFSELSPEIRTKTLRYMRVYFDLCSEEYDLWKGGYIDDRIWGTWVQGIEFAFSKKAFRDAWKIIELDTIYYPEFNVWVNSVNSKFKKE